MRGVKRRYAETTGISNIYDVIIFILYILQIVLISIL